MIEYIIPLIVSWLPMWNYVFNILVALAFVATVPCVLREVCRLYV